MIDTQIAPPNSVQTSDWLHIFILITDIIHIYDKIIKYMKMKYQNQT